MTLRETDLWSPSRLVLVRFPDVETANRRLDSVEYQQSFNVSRKSARSTAVVLEGEQEPARHQPPPTVPSSHAGQGTRVAPSSTDRSI
jgi:hypothetical protein